MVDTDLAQKVTGMAPPPVFILDASVLDYKEEHEAVREDIKLNRIEFVFPSGLTQVDIFEECRVLCDLDNFDNMYDYTMQALTGRDMIINYKHDDGTKSVLGEVHITDKHQDLRGLACIQESPWIVNWLVDFMAASLGERYPMPSKEPVPASERKEKNGKMLQKVIQKAALRVS
jgi:hypothetical protein